MIFEKADVIFAYTRKQAIADGVLVDVSELAREAGFRIPVALTHAVHVQCVKVPAENTSQDETERLMHLFWTLGYAIFSQKEKSGEIAFQVLVNNGVEEAVKLKSVCGPDDDGRACLTLMLPEED